MIPKRGMYEVCIRARTLNVYNIKYVITYNSLWFSAALRAVLLWFLSSLSLTIIWATVFRSPGCYIEYIEFASICFYY